MTDVNGSIGSLEKFDANWIDRKLPKSAKEFLAILEEDIVKAFDEIEILSEKELPNSAIQLTALVRIFLRRTSEYGISTKALPSGNAQIDVKGLRSELEWVGIGAVARTHEDIHKGYQELLNTRPPAWPNQDGALILFANSNNGLAISSEWQKFVRQMPCAISACQLRPMQFKSNSESATNGTPFRVWHTFMQLPVKLQLVHEPVPSYSDVVGSSASASPERQQDRRTHSIILIHGIRTQAEWQANVAAILERDPDIRVVSTRYEFFDAVRFFVPCAPLRQKPITRITKIIRDELSRRPAKISVIAHSFGTFIVSKVLEEETDIRFDRLVLCGSIVPDSFDWARYKGQLGGASGQGWQVINDCGYRDIWPVLAQTITWGYGSSGRFGFGHGRVKDRFHGTGHSGFLEPDFVEKYWVPYFSKDEIVNGESSRPTTSLLLSIATVFKVRYLIFGSPVGLAVYLLFKFVFG